MIGPAEDGLRALGVPPRRIVSERFDRDRPQVSVAVRHLIVDLVFSSTLVLILVRAVAFGPR